MLRDVKNLDFHPRSGSPLIDAGCQVKDITDGYQGKAPDIGAYETGGENWKPGVSWEETAIKKRLYEDVFW